MNNKIKEALDIIEELNEETNLHNEKFNLFTFNYSGWGNAVISFMGVSIWNDSDDSREYKYNPETDGYEPLKPFLIKESKKVVQNINHRMKELNK